MRLGGPDRINLNSKIQTFRTSEILSFKKASNRQTVVWREVKITVTTNHFPKTGVS